MSDQLLELDNRNPITASRLIKVFTRWKYYMSPYRENMREVLHFLAKRNLSSNSKEVLNLIIDE